MYEVGMSTDTEELGSDQNDVKNHQMSLLAQLQKGILLDYNETLIKSKENTRYSHKLWEAMHITFPIISTSTIVSKLHTGNVAYCIEPNVFRGVETQYLGPPKVKGIEDSSSE